MSTKAGRRYPWPHKHLPTRPNTGTIIADGTMTDQTIAEHLNTTSRTIQRYKQHGLPHAAADHLAIHILGTHPALIWHDWYHNESTP